MLDELLNQIDTDLNSAKLIDPKIWIDRSFRLSAFCEEEEIRLARLESAEAKVIEEIKVELASKGEKATSAAAENIVKMRPEWMARKTQEAKVNKINRFITNANKHASRMY